MREWIRRLIAMPMTSARRRAWALAEARAPALAAELAPRVVFDRNPWLREFARQRLRERGVTDFAALYGEALTENRDVEGALLGLMEVGSRGDVALVEHYLDDPSTAVRCASLRAVVHLSRRRDRDTGVSARASRILEKWKDIPPALYTSPSPALRAFLLTALPDMSDVPHVARTLSTVLRRS